MASHCSCVKVVTVIRTCCKICFKMRQFANTGDQMYPPHFSQKISQAVTEKSGLVGLKAGQLETRRAKGVALPITDIWLN